MDFVVCTEMFFLNLFVSQFRTIGFLIHFFLSTRTKQIMPLLLLGVPKNMISIANDVQIDFFLNSNSYSAESFNIF